MRVHLGPGDRGAQNTGSDQDGPSRVRPAHSFHKRSRAVRVRRGRALCSFPLSHPPPLLSNLQQNPNPSPWRRGSWPDPRPSPSPPPSPAPPPTRRRRSPEPARSRPCPATRPPRRAMGSARFVRLPDPSLLVLRTTSYLQIGMGDCDAIVSDSCACALGLICAVWLMIWLVGFGNPVCRPIRVCFVLILDRGVECFV